MTAFTSECKTLTRIRTKGCLYATVQMGLSWLVLLEACKFAGRKHRRLIYVRAVGPLLVSIAQRVGGLLQCSIDLHVLP